MTNTMVKVTVFLLVVLGIYLWIGYSITELTGGERTASAAVDVSPEGGEAIYWGKGRCFTCHSVGGQGSAVRGPNHGQFGEKFPLPMGARAAERAKERAEKTGEEFTAVDYIVESLSDPGAYVVKGYKNEMAVVYAPPISLNLNEIKAVVAYMMSLGGDLDMAAIDTEPGELTAGFYGKIAAAAAAGGGDPVAGQLVFEDNCLDCHVVAGEGGEGGEIGPDLSATAKKGLKFIAESILQPGKKITKGFETFVLVDKEGRKVVGLKSRDEGGEVDITKANGEVVTVAKAEIKEITQDSTQSLMPDDLSEAMTVKDYQDVLSFMMLQKGQ
ncbi:MAG: c-type cytochrome [Alphaproteobacteria bacterium]|jgi:putative heme-binding domain-containing protein|nr:c-type cytochrome [Alphaproteobacteria bacterium]MDP6564623.1 c-type cytochrome [Alphaproteobacteria bacterium]MDP6813009.1 c-type cytochrome [Alphaproteobacteria bacterium]